MKLFATIAALFSAKCPGGCGCGCAGNCNCESSSCGCSCCGK